MKLYMLPYIYLIQSLHNFTWYLLDVAHQMRNLASANRTRCCKVGSACSDSIDLLNGVVQGSCLGSLLFLIYINDIVTVFNDSTVCKAYADELKLYTVIQTCDVNKTSQRGLTSLEQWHIAWQFNVSERKCTILFVRRDPLHEQTGFNLLW